MTNKIDPTKLDPAGAFEAEKQATVASYKDELEWQDISADWMSVAFRKRYMYNFSWLGRPVIQIPTDMVATQELIWDVKPDLIIETGIAHGGSIVFSASILALLDVFDAAATPGTVFTPKRKVLGVDIDIRKHNRNEIEAHPLYGWIHMLEGSSTSQEIISQVTSIAAGYNRVMVFLDSNHTHDHVLAELEAYSVLTSKDSYCVVFDTIVEDMPEDMFPDRPWKPGDNPKTAVHEYLKILNHEGRIASDGDSLHLEVDSSIEDKLLLSVAPEGYLRRVS